MESMDSETRPVEVTTRYATSVSSLAEAWSFVMAKVDMVGPEPTIEIKPAWLYSMSSIGDDDAQGQLRFEVLVSGMVEEKSDA